MYAFGETVTVRRAEVVEDPYSGEPTGLSWANATDTEIPGCVVWPGETDEPNRVGREIVDVVLTVAMPPGTDVTAEDRVVVRGQVLEVAGQPFEYVNPFTGWRPGVVVPLTVREG